MRLKPIFQTLIKSKSKAVEAHKGKYYFKKMFQTINYFFTIPSYRFLNSNEPND